MSYSFHPELSTFTERYQQKESQLVWSEVVVDGASPVAVLQALSSADSPVFLLESVVGGERRGRYTLLGVKPDLMLKVEGKQASIARSDGQFSPKDFTPLDTTPFQALRDEVAAIRMDFPEGLPPLSAGLIGFMSYDTIRLHEKLPPAQKDTLGTPDALYMRPTIFIVFDNVTGKTFFITPVWKEQTEAGDAESAYKRACARLQQTLSALSQARVTSQAIPLGAAPVPLNFESNQPKDMFLKNIERIREYIRAGDIFQAVYSQRFSAPFAHSPLALYRALRYLNPSPYLFFFQGLGLSLVGSSPEILVRLSEGNKVTLRPIAGTRPRGKTHEEDAALEKDLLADAKECAEHLMLLDLGRHDVGRVAKAGTVKVTEQMQVERYSHVMHIVSNVEGELDEARADALDALMSGFPAGTVSGAPKIRAMEILTELEPEKRSFYAGCVGYFAANGNMDSCITLRTGLVKDGKLYVQAGGGIVYDSVPEAEFEESCNKAKALMRAAELAPYFA